MFTSQQLSIRQSHEGPVRRLTPVGELDLATVPVLESAFGAVCRTEDAEMIVVDLTELNFMDSTGIHLLLRMSEACGNGDRLRIVNGSRTVERILDVSGVRAHLPIISSDRDPLAPIDPTSGGSRISPRKPSSITRRPGPRRHL